MRNTWWISMISAGFKKQMIANVYNTQLLPVMDMVNNNHISNIIRIKNQLLFRKDDKSLWLGYKYKINTIDYDIFWFLYFLTNPIFSIYYFSEKNKEYNILSESDIKSILEQKQYIDNRLKYAKYLEDVHD